MYNSCVLDKKIRNLGKTLRRKEFEFSRGKSVEILCYMATVTRVGLMPRLPASGRLRGGQESTCVWPRASAPMAAVKGGATMSNWAAPSKEREGKQREPACAPQLGCGGQVGRYLRRTEKQ